MDIQKAWEQNSGSDDLLKNLLDKGEPGKIQSKLPLKKLKGNLLTGIVLGIMVTALYIASYFYISAWQVNLAVSILILFNTWILVDTWKLYKRTPDTITASFSLKQELEKNYDSFQRWWSLQERASLWVYPVALAGGFILGGMEGSGKSAEEFLYNPRILIFLGITILVMVPLCYFAAKAMFRYAYGRHLKKIKGLIGELSGS